MRHAVRVALPLAISFMGAALARPVTLEPLSTFGTPDTAYPIFAGAVAIDGDYALVTAERSEPTEPGAPGFATAFLFRLGGTHWTLVRRLEETRQLNEFDIRPGLLRCSPWDRSECRSCGR